MMKYLSLFSGIGGFEYGIIQSNKAEQLQCIGYSEVDKYAQEIYKKHFPDHPGLGDVTKINTQDLPAFDFMVGGFPCQAFSVAGKRRGFDDTRGTLFFEIARILKDKKPKYFLLENVKGLLSHDKGRTFQTILRTLAELGYDVQWEIFNSKNHGVPQNRERIYIKGILRTRCAGEILSLRETGTTINARQEENRKSVNWDWSKNHQCKFVDSNYNSLTLASGGHNSGSNQLIIEDDSQQVYAPDGISPTLMCSDYKHPKKILIKENTKKGYAESEPYDGIVLAHSNGRGRVQKQSIPTLDTNGTTGTLTDNYRIRRLTPVECERLQGFPDNWTKYGVDGEKISDTQRYKCCGNAVTTTVVRDIMNTWNMTID